MISEDAVDFAGLVSGLSAADVSSWLLVGFEDWAAGVSADVQARAFSPLWIHRSDDPVDYFLAELKSKGGLLEKFASAASQAFDRWSPKLHRQSSLRQLLRIMIYARPVDFFRRVEGLIYGYDLREEGATERRRTIDYLVETACAFHTNSKLLGFFSRLRRSDDWRPHYASARVVFSVNLLAPDVWPKLMARHKPDFEALRRELKMFNLRSVAARMVRRTSADTVIEGIEAWRHLPESDVAWLKSVFFEGEKPILQKIVPSNVIHLEEVRSGEWDDRGGDDLVKIRCVIAGKVHWTRPLDASKLERVLNDSTSEEEVLAALRDEEDCMRTVLRNSDKTPIEDSIRQALLG